MKVICPKCGKIIDTSGAKNVVFCSECGTTSSLEQAKKLYDREISQLSRAAFTYLNQKGDYDKAIELFNTWLDIDKTTLSPIIGIALATLYKQDFLNLNFDKIVPIIDQYDIYLDEENTFLFLSFMEDVIKETKKYLKEANTRLFKDGKCISKVYLDNYEKSLRDILSLITFFKDTLEISSQEERKLFYEDHDMDKELNELEETVKSLASINHEVLEEEETLEDNRIIVVNKKDLKTYYYAMGFEVVMAFVLIVFLILGFAVNSLFYYLMLIPLAIGIAGYLVYYFLFLKKKKL